MLFSKLDFEDHEARSHSVNLCCISFCNVITMEAWNFSNNTEVHFLRMTGEDVVTAVLQCDRQFISQLSLLSIFIYTSTPLPFYVH